MGKPLSVDEYDLLNFFATGPKPVAPDICWNYNCNEYVVENGAMQVSFTIEPSSKYVSLLMHVAGALVFEFSAQGVEDLKYHRDKAGESLEVVTAPQNSIWLTIKPTIAIRQFSSSF